MQLFFISREAYSRKEIPAQVKDEFDASELHLIHEGGYGLKGMQGAQYILKETDTTSYSHIVAAVGTGTMLAGLVNAAKPAQHVIGISVLKNNFSIETAINHLLPSPAPRYVLNHEYHFGGYAKSTPALFDFMNQWYQEHRIPSDFVYTAKLFYAVDDLLKTGHFPSGSKLLVIHSGGLQGNSALQKGKLIF
jgi:1-aminocyclopropane-1-carboxylate deaminase